MFIQSQLNKTLSLLANFKALMIQGQLFGVNLMLVLIIGSDSTPKTPTTTLEIINRFITNNLGNAGSTTRRSRVQTPQELAFYCTFYSTCLNCYVY